MSKFKHRLHISEAGSYGATLYVQPLNIATPVWLGHSSREDVRFTVREDDGREYHAQEVALARAEKRALEELRTALGSREALTAAREQIHARSPYLAVGKLLSVIAKDRFSRERLFDTYRDARDCIDNDNITRIIKAYGIGEVVFISPEGPHAGAGGLAQVISGLVPELERNEIPTTIIAPLYEEAHGNRHLSARETIRRGIRLGSRTVKPTLVGEVTVHLGPTFWADGSGLKRWPATVPLQVLCAEFGSARIFLLRNVSVFDRLYRPVLADEQLRRAIVLSRGALEAIATPRFGIRPSVIISNDWMTAFVPALVATDKRYRTHACLEGTTTLHMVHNGGADYQGKVPCRFYGEDVWPMLGLAPEHTFGFRDPVHPDLLNPTAAAARHATNGILTVSQPYAYQLTQPWGGDGLDVILSQRPESVFGISNGISRREIDAFFDRIAPGNPHRLAVDSLLDRKKAVRIRLQERYGLTIDGDATLVSFVGRLAEQKGLRLLSNWTHGEAISVLESILIRRPEVQILVAGPETADDTSAQELVHVLRHLVERYPGRIAFSIDYSPHPAALEIIFGSTFFLMPSRFEPGGITQLEALAAGTLVVARNVGGISTTIENFNPSNGTGNGFLCNEYDPTAFKNTLLWAIESASRMHTYRHLVAAARSARHDWGDRIPNYQALFRRLLLSHEELKEFESLGLS
jgi:starch synthase